MKDILALLLCARRLDHTARLLVQCASNHIFLCQMKTTVANTMRCCSIRAWRGFLRSGVLGKFWIRARKLSNKKIVESRPDYISKLFWASISHFFVSWKLCATSSLKIIYPPLRKTCTSARLFAVPRDTFGISCLFMDRQDTITMGLYNHTTRHLVSKDIYDELQKYYAS